MRPDDLLCRSIHHPKAFPNGVFSDEALLLFVEGDNDSYALSVGSRFILGSDDAAHQYGIRTAKVMNGRASARKGRPLNDDEVVHYLGLYDLRYEAVTQIKLSHYDVSVRWRLENGEHAHFEIELNPTSPASPKQRKNDRKDARTLLALCLRGPILFDGAPEDLRATQLQLPSLAEQPFPGVGNLVQGALV